MSAVVEARVLTTNPFVGGSKIGNRDFVFDHCVLRDPDEVMPPDWVGYEVLTAKDGGKRVSWSKMNMSQICEAKQRFEELIGEGLVPYYIDPAKPGEASEIPMTEFDPGAGAAIFERPDFNPSRVVLAPTRMAVGG